MKKAILMLLVALPFMSKAQIQMKEDAEEKLIGDVHNGNYLKAELRRSIKDHDTSYFIIYKNEKYEVITDFQSLAFTGGEATLQQFYEILRSAFLPANINNKDYKKEFVLGEDDVTVANFIRKSIMVWTSNGYFSLTENETDKLFGRIN